jgi:hypothetical protein
MSEFGVVTVAFDGWQVDNELEMAWNGTIVAWFEIRRLLAV